MNKKFALFAWPSNQEQGGAYDLKAIGSMSDCKTKFLELAFRSGADQQGHVLEVETGRVVIDATAYRKDVTVIVGQPMFQHWIEWVASE